MGVGTTKQQITGHAKEIVLYLPTARLLVEAATHAVVDLVLGFQEEREDLENARPVLDRHRGELSCGW